VRPSLLDPSSVDWCTIPSACCPVALPTRLVSSACSHWWLTHPSVTKDGIERVCDSISQRWSTSRVENRVQLVQPNKSRLYVTTIHSSSLFTASPALQEAGSTPAFYSCCVSLLFLKRDPVVDLYLFWIIILLVWPLEKDAGKRLFLHPSEFFIDEMDLWLNYSSDWVVRLFLYNANANCLPDLPTLFLLSWKGWEWSCLHDIYHAACVAYITDHVWFCGSIEECWLGIVWTESWITLWPFHFALDLILWVYGWYLRINMDVEVPLPFFNFLLHVDLINCQLSL
jgi:hypothetical protein